MSGLVDDVIYYATAPLRLFGRSRSFRLITLAVVVSGGFFAATLWALDSFLPASTPAAKVVAKLAPLAPLQPLTRASYVIAPVAISLNAIQRSLEASTPRTMTGQGNNPVSGILSKADIGMTITRGNMAVNGRAGEMTVLTQLTGSLKVTGQLATQAGNLTGGAVGGITGLLDGALGRDVGKVVGGLTGKVLDQNVELRSQVTVRSKPSIAGNWRLHPNLAAQVAVSDSAVQIAGFKINMANEAKPLIERAVNEQVAGLETRLRNDPLFERSAREQWAKMCRSIPLGGGDTGLPQLWLEMRPVRAAAAQPQIDARNVTLVVGVQADTRITPKESKPECPFPAALDLVPPMENGKLSIGLPIDVPFTELNRLLNAQLKGKRYPEGTHAPVEVEVRSASLAASDDRLLIALKVKAHERKSWFGFGADADINIWGRPKLDPGTQVLSLTDISLAVESEAAFGLLGTAARAAMPYLQQALADNAVIDLTPFLNDAKAKISAALGDFRKAGEGVEVEAAVSNLRLTGIAFDSTTLRVIAEAEGSARVSVTYLPRM
ncbi:MAG: DUF4403 family protein [Pseudolabrys sp.]|nr:DUF4403 family protein [Pseudolabrys sp.]MDP2297800.1 DUF4403 family protein [Pseudolabrys sp.]